MASTVVEGMKVVGVRWAAMRVALMGAMEARMAEF